MKGSFMCIVRMGLALRQNDKCESGHACFKFLEDLTW